jgi:hypothetical protein
MLFGERMRLGRSLALPQRVIGSYLTREKA